MDHKASNARGDCVRPPGRRARGRAASIGAGVAIAWSFRRLRGEMVAVAAVLAGVGMLALITGRAIYDTYQSSGLANCLADASAGVGLPSADGPLRRQVQWLADPDRAAGAVTSTVRCVRWRAACRQRSRSGYTSVLVDPERYARPLARVAGGCCHDRRGRRVLLDFRSMPAGDH